MKKRTTIIIGLVLILIIALSILSVNLLPKKPKEKIFFNPLPENWIYDNPSTQKEDILIDPYIATEGKAIIQKDQQDYRIDNTLYSFFYFGVYDGADFDSEYLPPDFFNKTQGTSLSEKRKLADKEALMRITNQFDANDNQINGFILARKENNDMEFHIFLDQDWKDQLEFTNIVWGDNFNDPTTLNERPFNFNKEEQGVYIDKLNTNVGWYKQPSIKGGIIVGEITKGTLKQLMRDQQLNITFMMVR